MTMSSIVLFLIQWDGMVKVIFNLSVSIICVCVTGAPTGPRMSEDNR